jgi:hypothetical protein
MSRSFDIIERAQQDRDLFRVPPVTGAPSNGAFTSGKTSPDLSGFAREEVLRLVQRIFLAADTFGSIGLRRVVFCGIDEADGSRLLSAQVGRVLAEQIQSQVCIVDADLRTLSANSLVDLLPLQSASLSAHEPSNAIMRKVTDNLWLVPANALHPDGMGLTLDELRTWIGLHGCEFGHVVINGPPIGLHNDTVLLGQLSDGAVLVLEANSTRWQTARKAKDALESANVRVLGTVLNNRTFPIPEKLYRWL